MTMPKMLKKFLPGAALCLLLVPVLAFMLSGCADKDARKKAEARVALCLEHFDERRYPMALAECLKAEEADDEYPEVYNAKGLIYMRQGRFTEAIENFQKGLDLDPKLSNARTNLGIAYAEIGRLDEALEQFEIALSDDLHRSPDVTLTNMCEVYLRKKQYAKAVDYCRQAIDRNRAQCFAHYTLGRAYVELGQPRSTIDEMGLAVKYCPNWYDPVFLRGEMRLKLKQFPQACNDFWDVIDADPEGKLAIKARRYTERLKCTPRPVEPTEAEKSRKSERNPRNNAQPLPYAR
ncbi:MAG: tetratricopeptide repeat protein [Chrysiogenetes bacterium]|nr:tetratricopeptide repeat protein [Chrysiogenetes bacterium]